VSQDPVALVLTDGVVLLDRFADTDVGALWAGEDNGYVRRSRLPGPFTRHDIANQISHWENQWQRGGPERSFAIRETGTRGLVGGCTLGTRPDDGEIAELSYWVFPPYRCRGYATRAVGLVCRYAFDNLGVARMDLYIEPTNDASLRVATKAGFLREGLLRQDDHRCGGRREMALYSRLRTDDVRWKPPQSREPGEPGRVPDGLARLRRPGHEKVEEPSRE
jgi:RimJ/RimL family protein N-acetyltransferase